MTKNPSSILSDAFCSIDGTIILEVLIKKFCTHNMKVTNVIKQNKIVKRSFSPSLSWSTFSL